MSVSRQPSNGLADHATTASSLADCDCPGDPWIRVNSGTILGRYVIVVYCRVCGSHLAGHLSGGDDT